MGLNLMFNSKKVVRYIPVNGINHKTVKKVQEALKLVNKGNTDALLVGINSQAGKDSIVDAEIMADMFDTKIKKMGGQVRLVTYAEESCTNVCMHLLTRGDIVLANRMSFLGDIGYYRQATIFKHHLAHHWMSEVKLVH